MAIIRPLEPFPNLPKYDWSQTELIAWFHQLAFVVEDLVADAGAGPASPPGAPLSFETLSSGAIGSEQSDTFIILSGDKAQPSANAISHGVSASWISGFDAQQDPYDPPPFGKENLTIPATQNIDLTQGGRLTLTTAVPVLVSSVTAATTVFYTPYINDIIWIWSGVAWVQYSFTETSLALDSDTGHTGFHASGSIFDLFMVNDAGVRRLGTGPAWTSDTARGAGAGTTELARRNGIWTNAVSMTLRFGSVSGNTITVGVNQGTYVGTMRASANGQTEVSFGGLAAGGTAANVFLWNAYHRKQFSAMMRDSTDTYVYAVAAWRASNASVGMRCNFVTGLQEEMFSSSFSTAANETAGTTAAFIGIGDNVVTTYAGSAELNASDGLNDSMVAEFHQTPAIGFRFLAAIEYAVGGAVTFVPDNGTPVFWQNGLFVRGWF